LVQSQTRKKDQSIQAEESQARSREDQDGDGPSDDVFLLKLQTERAVMAATVTDGLAGLDISKDKTADYKKLIEYGLDAKVADKLDEIYKTEKLSHSDLDERALDALKEFPVEGALAVLKQFLESNLEHVSNKSAYLCGVMKTYRQKTRAGASANSNGAATNNSHQSSPTFDKPS